MKLVDIKKDGTTTVELTDEEAHAIRDVLGLAPSTEAWGLHRLLSHAHGDKEN
ncbi:hypothetical protein ACFYMO_04050 [Streptomyces sp. NPDC007025]|uniref:hypothetical protein n=1 Tax=Streptomyces sp. NPDC007025 TaxID=3364771 RepID=UPI00367E9B5A